MKRSPIMNLKTGLTFCPVCGWRYSWDIQVCPNSDNHKGPDGLTRAQIREIEARTEETQRPDDYDSASEGHP